MRAGRRLALAGAALWLMHQAQAADLGTVGGFDVRLDTSVRLSLGLRTDGRDAALLAGTNGDDGDRAFSPGVISERIDFSSVLDATRGDLGLEASMDGWYDAIYHQADANHHAATFNPVGVAVNQFPPQTRDLLGQAVELGTAFVHDRFEVAGLPVTVRIGRQSLLWGESLFFPQDGLAAGQAPVDVIKALSQPLVENAELFLPVDQAYLRAELGGGVSLQGYEQLEWRRNRTPGVASYFSSSDLADAGGDRAFLPGGQILPRTKDLTPGGFGQFGVALRYASDIADLGLYALRYDSKQGFVRADGQGYRLVFPRGIEAAGLSASSYIGDGTIAGEVSLRQHAPLVSTGLGGASTVVGGGTPYAGVYGPAELLSPQASRLTACAGCAAAPAAGTGYATGRVLLALASLERQLPTGRLWQGATLDAELSTTELLDVQSGGAARLAGRTRFSSAAEAVFVPHYYQVLPELDLSVPVGLAWGLSGRSSVDAGQVARVGNVTLSVAATYRAVWQFGVSFTHFLGPVTQQALADRAFVTVSLGRTF